MKIGIFDHVSRHLGGGQLVVAWLGSFLAHDHDVEIIHSGKGYTLESLGKAFGVELGHARERIIENSLGTFKIPWSKSLPLSLLRRIYFDQKLTRPYDLFIFLGHGIPPFCFSRSGMIYCHFPAEPSPVHSIKNSEGWKRKSSLQRRLRLPFIDGLWRWRMGKYRTILANSHFTASWIDRLWERPASVAYPPVPLKLARMEKRNHIVSLGRFVGKDRKNHVDQVKAFPRFLSQVEESWSLLLIGFGSDHDEDQAYLSHLRSLARDLPVRFIVNAEREEVLRHLAEAKLFWHTAGFGIDPDKNPYRLEHFGISTVEAMRASCVPIVSAYGGQAEIIEEGISGFLCQGVDELIQSSVTLANDKGLFEHMSSESQKRSLAFLPEKFESSLSQFVLQSNGSDHKNKNLSFTPLL